MNNEFETEYLIVGSGMVGLSLAHQLTLRKISKSIICIDKESQLGMHSSGRNSGVLHAGLYYKPGTIKAKVCVNGAKRLRKWIEERNLPLNKCGKVVVPQDIHLDKQLDLLFNRGKENGARVEMWDKKQLNEFSPMVRTASQRALWSPNTCVVKPLKVLERLAQELKSYGVKIFTNNTGSNFQIDFERSKIISSEYSIKYKHLINCAGLYADKIAHSFDVGLEYRIIPFRGNYWEIKSPQKFKINSNVYPVPDLNMPFLGVHFTPSADNPPKITIGPTATFVMGRENYSKFNSMEPFSAVENLLTISKLFLLNKGGFRKYVKEQSFLSIPFLLTKASQVLIPDIKAEDIKLSEKVGIRAQLFNKNTSSLENDFICKNKENTTHILNAISPAFTASFELADFIIDNYLIKK